MCFWITDEPGAGKRQIIHLAAGSGIRHATYRSMVGIYDEDDYQFLMNSVVNQLSEYADAAAEVNG